MSRAETAVKAFNSGLCCSQAVLGAYASSLGLDADSAARIAAGFGGGMGRLAGTCGAVTGAFMALGLASDATAARKDRAKTYASVREFAQRFAARNGSLDCKTLLGCDVSTPEGAARAESQSLYTTTCSRLVRDAVEILEEMLQVCA